MKIQHKLRKAIIYQPLELVSCIRLLLVHKHFRQKKKLFGLLNFVYGDIKVEVIPLHSYAIRDTRVKVFYKLLEATLYQFLEPLSCFGYFSE